MPIRKELRRYYGAQWKQKRREALNLRGHYLCDNCGHAPVVRRGHYYVYGWLNWCHLSGDPRQPGEMAFLCPRCHAIHDSGFRVALGRRTRARKYGQLWLSPELELAAYPRMFWPPE